MKVMKKYIKKYSMPFSVSIIFLVIEALCDLLLPTILAIMIDRGVALKDMDFVLEMGGIMLLVTVTGAIAANIRNILSSNISQRLGAELRTDLYQKIQSFSFVQMNRFGTATLVTRLTNDVTQVQVFVNGLMRIMVKAPILSIGSIIMAIRLNPSISWILFVVVPIVGVLILLNLKLSFPFFLKVQKATDQVNGVVREFLSGIRVIRAFNRSLYERERFESNNNRLMETSIKANRVMSVFNPGISLTVNFGIVAVLLVGGWKINEGSMAVGQIIAYVNYMTQILISLMLISIIFTIFVRARVSINRITEVLAVEPHDAVQADSLVDAHHSSVNGLEYRDITFTYEGSKEAVLDNISFSVKPGETVGIIGSTGSGKSSLVNLLMRFYEPDKGTICLNGIDIQAISPHILRSHIAYVPQESILFTGSIKENLLWGNEAASMHDIKEAAELAHAYEFIRSLPDGFDTVLGQGGVNLSGGQKQRLSLARALIKKAEILILDDSMSAIDGITEQRIKTSLKQSCKDTIVLMIAQRISSIQDADRIIVLENGQVAGIGTHETLSQHNEVYQDIMQSQLGEVAYD